MGVFAAQAALLLRDSGILKTVAASGEAGTPTEEIISGSKMTDNSCRVLLEAGLGIGLLYGTEDRYYLTTAGHYYLNDATVRTNTDFMRDVCLPGIGKLPESLQTGTPKGLQVFGQWDRLFDALQSLPEQTRRSWYAFNNHHSDAAFGQALSRLFAHNPQRILDIGGSTGRFALACLDYSDTVHIGIADLISEQVQLEPGITSAVRAGRVTLHPVDVLHVDHSLPEGYDTIWMSQFLPCFAEDQVRDILAKCYAILPADGRIWLMETFWDRQRHEAAASSLQLTSLYFVNVATGNSRMYRSTDLLKLIHEAGFTVAAQEDGIGQRHTLLELRKT